MINKIKYIYLIIIIISIINNNYCNSQTLVDVTPSGTRKKAYLNSNNVCNYNLFYYLCDSSPCDYTSLDPPNVVFLQDSVSNGTSTIHTLAIRSLTSTGLYTIKFNDIELFTIECLEIDFDSISFKKVIDYFVVPDIETSSVSYTTVYQIVAPNIDYSIITTYEFYIAKCLQLKCSVSMDGDGYISFSFDLSSNFQSLVNVPITISLADKLYQIEPILKENYSNITNIKTYPSSEFLNNYQMQGVGEGGVIEITMNNTDYYSPFLLYVNLSPVESNIQYYPIKGDNQSTTFLLSMADSSITNYQLLYQNGLTFSNYQSNILCNIKDYSIGQIGSLWSLTSISNLLKPMASLSFSLDKYSFTSIDLKVVVGNENIIQKLKFPFGFISNSNNGFSYKVDLLARNINIFGYLAITLSLPSEMSPTTRNYYSTQPYDASKSIKLNKVQVIRLYKDIYLYKAYPTFDYEFGHFIVNAERIGIESKVKTPSGTPNVYELLVNADFDQAIQVFDCYGGNIGFYGNTLLSGNNYNSVEFFIPPFRVFNFDMYSIQNVSYLYNDLDVTNHRQYNVMYFNYTDDVPRDITISMIVADLSISSNIVLPQRQRIDNLLFSSSYNYELGLFEIEFFIDANIAIGQFQFLLNINGYIFYSKYLNEQLIIKKSSMDLQGPLITKVKRSEQLNISDYILSSSGDIYWDMTIEDTINGFDYGYIVIRGSLDQSIYNFTITPSNAISGDIFIGQYQFKFQVNYPCVSQNYVISEVVLYDRLKRMSIYSTYVENPLYAGVMNPFLNLLNDPTIYSIPLTCQQSNPVAAQDTTPPVLTSFTSSVNSVDIFTLPNITFNFAASDLESGIKKDQYPIVYLSTTFNKILECKSNITSITKNITTVYGNTITYSCTIQIPLGFGYLDGISLSVYGFINNNGYYSGYSTTDLNDNGKDYYIATTYNESSNPVFTSYYRISERGGDLWLTGRGFTDSITLVTVEYEDGTSQNINADNVHFTVLRVPGIRPTTRPFKVSSPTSNTITVIPTIFDYYLNNSTDSSSSSLSSSSSSSDMLPTSSPLPTNSPQSCPGNPICGGLSNGKCIENQGCVCYSPWIGLDCLSQIIIIDQPTTNDTSPSTNITLPVNNNNSSTTVTYKSLITLVSIRELNILGSVVYNKSFDKWQVRELDSTTFIYNTTLSINKNSQISTTEFTVTLKWFTNETTIKFANEQLLMNPSTMKYTIEINNYPFDNNLNQLQLIMSASLQSNSSDNICSLREYGETTSGDNSNYLKIQVDNHSLFGRFIRRGIIDSTTTTITNVLLDKDMNSITTTKELQSYIAIQIPNYKISVIVDPDFSIIIDSYSASSKSNSICSSKSKLTNGKIAGIVIGCAAFLAVIIIAVSYHIIKKKKDAKFVQSVNQKMKNMNNDKL